METHTQGGEADGRQDKAGFTQSRKERKGKTMTDVQTERVLEIFKDTGMIIELGANFSVRGQIAQLLNGCEQLIDKCAIIAGTEDELSNHPDGQRVADAVRNQTLQG
jgi:hypothetical protein